MQKEILLKPRVQILITLIFLVLTPSMNYFLMTHNPSQNRLFMGDPDYLDNGNILVCGGDLFDTFRVLERINEDQQYIPKEERTNFVMEITRDGERVWAARGLDFPHEAIKLPNGDILVADTLNDRVVRYNYPNHFIVWKWRVDDINWEDVNPEWDQDHYYNNNNGSFDWSHLNDIDIHHYEEGWDGLLISIRNFDLIVELNYTAAQEHFPRASDIVWWYGDYQNHTMLNHQHNPDYLSNGNIIVADSENHRIIEINKTTKEIVWSYNGTSNGNTQSDQECLKWCRDVNEVPESIEGDFLISDIDRIFMIDKQTKQVVWEFEDEILQAYTTEIDEERGNLLVDCSFLGKIIEVDIESKEIIWQFGKSLLKQMLFFDCSMFMAFFGFRYAIIQLKFSKVKKTEMKHPNRSRYFQYLCGGMIVFLALLMIFHLEILRWVLYRLVSTHDIG